MPTEPVRPHEIVKLLGPAGTIRILNGFELGGINLVQEWGEYGPRSIEFVIADKVRVVAAKDVKDESLIGIRDPQVRVAALVGQVELRDGCLEGEAWELVVKLHINGLIWLHTDDELVSRHVLEKLSSNIPELDTNFHFGFIESLAGFENKGYPWVLEWTCERSTKKKKNPRNSATHHHSIE